VAAEADACAKDMTATLRGRLAGQAGDAAECIQLMRQLGEPVENLQVRCLPVVGSPSCLSDRQLKPLSHLSEVGCMSQSRGSHVCRLGQLQET